MIIHTNPLFTVYFGGASDGLSSEQYQAALAGRLPIVEPFEKLKKFKHLDSLIFLRQTHSADGAVIENAQKTMPSFVQEGDFLITNTKAGIGILTADCLPVIIHDNFHNIVTVVHAGWRGSAKGIVQKALAAMHTHFNTNTDHIRILFGPSAKTCCYKVSEDFVQGLEAFPFAHQVIIQRGSEYFFDLPAYNRLQLEALGIKKEALCQEYNICTICHDTFNSYRRQGEQAGRQMTVVWLS